jgi:hypothetical protein
LKIGDMTLAISVTEDNREDVLEGLRILLGAGAVTATAYGGPQPDAAQAGAGEAPKADAPKAGRRGSRKAAEAQQPDAAGAAGAPPPADEKPADPPPAGTGGNPFGGEAPAGAADAKPAAADPFAGAAPPAGEKPADPPPAGEAPQGLEQLNDMLNRFAAKHGVPATRRVITSFGVTRLAELDPARWPELVAKLTAENGGTAP